jgi:hypothetical protein
LETCPFNVLHRFLPQDKDEHLKSCIDRGRILSNRPIIAPPSDEKPSVSEIEKTRKLAEASSNEDWDRGKLHFKRKKTTNIK